MKKRYKWSDGLSPKEIRKLMETDALICIDGCEPHEKEADKKIENILKMKNEGKLSTKAAEKMAEEVLFKAKKKQRRKK
jgi:hypothetical protein